MLPPKGAFRTRHPQLGDCPYVLFLGRLHPKKGLDYLVEAFTRLAETTQKPVLLWSYTVPAQKSVQVLSEAGLPLYTDIRNCARTMRVMADYRALRERFLRPIEVSDAPTPDKASAHAALAAAGTALCEWEARPILACYGIGGNAAGTLAGSADEAVAAARARFVASDLSDPAALAEAFAGCDAVAHCAGINREIGAQTYRRVHIEGTRRVLEAALQAGVRKLVLLSFLRARPNCGSAYHESKWAAEEIIRSSGLNYTIFKAGVIYGRGDHMLDHLSHALYTFPVFGLVGMKEKPIRPLAVEDLVKAIVAAFNDARLSNKTMSIAGPEEIVLSEAVRRVGQVIGKKPLCVPTPIAIQKGIAWMAERTMKIPLLSLAQLRILSEGIVEELPACDALPNDLLPATRFTAEQIQKGLPEPGAFGLRDLRCSKA